MQLGVGKLGLQRRPFFFRLLHPVLAEYPVPGFESRANTPGGMALANRYQGHVSGRVTCHLGGLSNTCSDLGQIVYDISLVFQLFYHVF